MSEKLPVVSAREMLRALTKAGFHIHHQSGSHVQLKHRTKTHLRLTVPFHSRDLPKAVIRRIIHQADLSVEEFRGLV